MNDDAALDPEARDAAGIVPRHWVESASDRVGDVKARSEALEHPLFRHVGGRLGARQNQVVGPARVAGRAATELARGVARKEFSPQDAFFDDRAPLSRAAFVVEDARADRTGNVGILKNRHVGGKNGRALPSEEARGLAVERPPRKKVFEHVQEFGRDVGCKEHPHRSARNGFAPELCRGPFGRTPSERLGVGEFLCASALSPPGVLFEVVPLGRHRHAVDVVTGIVVARGKAKRIDEREAPRRSRKDRAVRVLNGRIDLQGGLFGLREVGDRVLGRSLIGVAERQIPKFRLQVALLGKARRLVFFSDACDRDCRAHRALDGSLGKVRGRGASPALPLPDGDREHLFRRVFEGFDLAHSIGHAEAPVGAHFGRALVGSEPERAL